MPMSYLHRDKGSAGALRPKIHGRSLPERVDNLRRATADVEIWSCSIRDRQVAGEFVDVGISGSKDSRPQLDAMGVCGSGCTISARL